MNAIDIRNPDEVLVPDDRITKRRWAGVLVDSAGVTVVQNPAAGLWSDDAR